MNTPYPLNTGNRPGAATAASPAIRTPDQRVRVFVSSTLDELAAERAAVREAIIELRLTPVLFESGARPYPPRELYRAYVAQRDIFVGPLLAALRLGRAHDAGVGLGGRIARAHR